MTSMLAWWSSCVCSSAQAIQRKHTLCPALLYALTTTERQQLKCTNLSANEEQRQC